MKKSLITIYLFVFMAMANAQTAGTLTVLFSTNYGTSSSYSEYVADIYITNSAGTLVNTLLYRTSNTHSSGSYLPTWWSLIGSSLSNTSLIKMVSGTDGITGATAKSSSFYTNQSVYWGKSTSVSSVTDATYNVHFEICNCTSGGGGLTKYSFPVAFIKGTNVSSASNAAGLGYKNISISWIPVNTAIQDLESDKLYSVYPNPAVSSIFVSGMDINQVDICSLNGQRILTSNQQKVDLSGLSKGNYLAVIYAKSGAIVKKIQKL